jgi:hypothetical protein
MKRKSKKAPRRKMVRITEEMKQWASMLGQELGGWPQVTSRPMFGLLGFHREGKIFAALPVTRAIGSPNSIIFKIAPMPPDLQQRAMADPRVDSASENPGLRWRAFDIQSTEDLRDALWWLSQAYERATSGARRMAKSSRGGG